MKIGVLGSGDVGRVLSTGFAKSGHDVKLGSREPGTTDSLGERVQRLLPQAKVVKAFNTVGNPHMVKPDFPGGPPDMFIGGNDAQAKQTVTNLLKEFGWPAVDIGGIEGARYLEALAMVWISYFFKTGSGNHAFKLLRK